MTRDRVVVIGGGLAGITAAIGLAEAGLPVTVLEARPWLGGATWSFGRRGLTIDNGQHAFFRCFTAYRDLLTRLGVGGSVRLQDRLDLTVLTSQGSHRLRRSGWPAPLHLARMLAGYPTLSGAERLGVVPAMMAFWLSDLSGTSRDNASIGEWLSRHGQSEQARSEFWDLFLVPVLNAASDEADLGTAAGIINTALLSGRDQADIGTASVPLRDLHAAPAGRLLVELGAEVRLGAEVTAIRCAEGGGYRVRIGAEDQPGQLSFGECDPDLISAAGVVLAVPPWTAAALVPAELAALAATWAGLAPSPVVSAHVIYDTRVTRLPFAATSQSPVRWITDKTRSAGLHAGQYLAASMPAADRFVDAPTGAIRAKVLPMFERLFPAASAARVEDFFVTRERTATFRPAPGSLASRPDQATKLRGFALAGAWTSTGWPDTMEGAVRSGRLAAQSILRTLAATGDREHIPAHTSRALAPAAAPGPPGAATGPTLPVRVSAAGKMRAAAARLRPPEPSGQSSPEPAEGTADDDQPAATAQPGPALPGLAVVPRPKPEAPEPADTPQPTLEAPESAVVSHPTFDAPELAVAPELTLAAPELAVTPELTLAAPEPAVAPERTPDNNAEPAGVDAEASPDAEAASAGPEPELAGPEPDLGEPGAVPAEMGAGGAGPVAAEAESGPSGKQINSDDGTAVGRPRSRTSATAGPGKPARKRAPKSAAGARVPSPAGPAESAVPEAPTGRAEAARP